MTKWFDTNYHYLVPELEEGQALHRRGPGTGPASWPRRRRWASPTRPVILGPASFLLLSKGLERPLDSLPRLVPAYATLLRAMAALGAREVQVDEPCLALDRTGEELDAIEARLGGPGGRDRSRAVPDDLLRRAAPGRRPGARARPPGRRGAPGPGARGRPSSRPRCGALAGGSTRLSLGVVDGRNVWAADLDRALGQIDAAVRGARAGAGHDRALVLAAARALRGRPRDRDPRRGARLARVRRGAARRAGGAARRRRGLAAAPRRAARAGARGGARRGATRPSPTTPRCARGRRRCGPRTTTARPRADVRREVAALAGAACPSCPRRRSARSPRPTRSGPPAGRTCGRASWTTPDTSGSSRARSPRWSPSRRRSASTCWCTASPSATTWSSTSAACCAGSASPSTAGCSRTAAAACGRRSSTATSRAPRR